MEDSESLLFASPVDKVFLRIPSTSFFLDVLSRDRIGGRLSTGSLLRYVFPTFCSIFWTMSATPLQ